MKRFERLQIGKDLGGGGGVGWGRERERGERMGKDDIQGKLRNQPVITKRDHETCMISLVKSVKQTVRVPT